MEKASERSKPAEKLLPPPTSMWARASQQDPGPSRAAKSPPRLSLVSLPYTLVSLPYTGDKHPCSTLPLTRATATV